MKAWPGWAGTPEAQEALQAGVIQGLLPIRDAGEKSEFIPTMDVARRSVHISSCLSNFLTQ